MAAGAAQHHRNWCTPCLSPALGAATPLPLPPAPRREPSAHHDPPQPRRLLPLSSPFLQAGAPSLLAALPHVCRVKTLLLSRKPYSAKTPPLRLPYLALKLLLEVTPSPLPGLRADAGPGLLRPTCPGLQAFPTFSAISTSSASSSSPTFPCTLLLLKSKYQQNPNPPPERLPGLSLPWLCRSLLPTLGSAATACTVLQPFLTAKSFPGYSPGSFKGLHDFICHNLLIIH